MCTVCNHLSVSQHAANAPQNFAKRQIKQKKRKKKKMCEFVWLCLAKWGLYEQV